MRRNLIETGSVDDKPPSSLCTSSNVIQSGSPVEVSEEVRHPFWNDWQWQMQRRLRTSGQLTRAFKGLKSSEDWSKAAEKFPFSITPYYLSLIERPDYTDPIFKMAVRDILELSDPPCLTDDPLEEQEDMPVPGLVHRYPDRALVIITTTCSCYCRHCTRKRTAGRHESSISPIRLQQIVEYLTGHPEIHDVILSGGDPFTMTTEKLERVLAAIRPIPSIDIIRIGTRTPVVLPMRINQELVTMLKRYHPLYVNTHFNHPRELTPEAAQACSMLADAGIPLGNQTVLLRGVNDDPKILAELFGGLVRIRVKPYYLFQCDLVRGVEHFRTPLSRGIEIMEYLRGRISGLAIPTFVVDASYGGGKIPILPNYIVSVSPTHTVLRNQEGLIISYPEPNMTPVRNQTANENDETIPGIWELSTGRHNRIEPNRSVRGDRRQNTGKITRRKGRP